MEFRDIPSTRDELNNQSPNHLNNWAQSMQWFCDITSTSAESQPAQLPKLGSFPSQLHRWGKQGGGEGREEWISTIRNLDQAYHKQTVMCLWQLIITSDCTNVYIFQLVTFGALVFPGWGFCFFSNIFPWRRLLLPPPGLWAINRKEPFLGAHALHVVNPPVHFSS